LSTKSAPSGRSVVVVTQLCNLKTGEVFQCDIDGFLAAIGHTLPQGHLNFDPYC
jgi:hypothetical protein